MNGVDDEWPFRKWDRGEAFSVSGLDEVELDGRESELEVMLIEEEAPGKSVSCNGLVLGDVPNPESSDEMWLRKSDPLQPAVGSDPSCVLIFDRHCSNSLLCDGFPDDVPLAASRTCLTLTIGSTPAGAALGPASPCPLAMEGTGASCSRASARACAFASFATRSCSCLCRALMALRARLPSFWGSSMDAADSGGPASPVTGSTCTWASRRLVEAMHLVAVAVGYPNAIAGRLE